MRPTNLDANRDELRNRSAEVGRADAERHVVAKDTTTQILVALDMLPTEEKRAIETAYYGQCSYREAAIALGESERAVKLRIRSGLRRLAALSGSPARTVGDGS